MPRMRSQAQIVEESRLDSRKRKTRRSLKKRKQRRRMMRRNIPTRRKMKRRGRKRWIKRKRKKVKIRKRKEKEKVDAVPPYPGYLLTIKCRQRLALRMEFMVCIVFVWKNPDRMKCLRRLEDTYVYCDMSSNPNKEERIYVEGFSKAQDP